MADAREDPKDYEDRERETVREEDDTERSAERSAEREKVEDTDERRTRESQPANGSDTKRSEPAPLDDRQNKVFVGGISWDTTQDGLERYFKKFGEVVETILMMNRETNTPRGFGFVTFRDPEVVNKILGERHIIDGRSVELKRAVPKSDMDRSGGGGSGGGRGSSSDPTKIFVGGLNYSAREEDLRDYFSKFGRIQDCVVMYDRHTRRSRGFGFVTFEDSSSVEEVLKERHHTILDREVEIKRAEPRPDKHSRHDHGGGYGMDPMSMGMGMPGMGMGMPGMGMGMGMGMPMGMGMGMEGMGGGGGRGGRGGGRGGRGGGRGGGRSGSHQGGPNNMFNMMPYGFMPQMGFMGMGGQGGEGDGGSGNEMMSMDPMSMGMGMPGMGMGMPGMGMGMGMGMPGMGMGFGYEGGDNQQGMYGYGGGHSGSGSGGAAPSRSSRDRREYHPY